jgi:hypothetical protein
MGKVYLIGTEEWEYLIRPGIDVEVIPGVSSALAVPSLVGIPPTCRGGAHALEVCSQKRGDNMRFLLLAQVAALAGLLAGSVYGQAAASGSTASASTAASGPIKLGGVTVTGSLRSRLYGWDWFQPAAGDNSYAYTGNLLRVGFSQSREKWDWNAEFAVPFILGLPDRNRGRSDSDPTT